MTNTVGRLAVTALFAVVALIAPLDSEVPHFALTGSAPAAGSTVASVDEIRLTFSQVPQANSVSVRLVTAGGDLVETSALESDPSDGTIVFVGVDTHLDNGTYTVAWRGIGDDGHVVSGDFAFTLAAQR